MPETFELREIEAAIAKLADNDYAGQSLLQQIKNSVVAGAEIPKDSIGGIEIQKILDDLNYDFQNLNEWVERELQILRAEIDIATSGNITLTEIQGITLDENDYAGKAIIGDLIVLINAGINIPKNSSSGAEIMKMISGVDYDLDIIISWIENQNANILETQVGLKEINDFEQILGGNIVLLEQKEGSLTSVELNLLQAFNTFNVYIDRLGITPEKVRLYEAYIGAKRIGQINVNGLPVSPDTGRQLSSDQLTRGQRFFSRFGDNRVRHYVEDTIEGWTSYESPAVGTNDHMIIEDDDLRLVRSDVGKPDYSVDIRDADSVFLLLMDISEKLQNGSFVETDLERFNTVLMNFPRDIQSIDRIQTNDTFISPEYVMGLQSTNFFDSMEDAVGRDFNEEGRTARRLYEGFHGINTSREMSLEQLAGTAKNAFDFDYSIIDEASIDSLIGEIKAEGATIFTNGVDRDEEERLKNILVGLSQYSTKPIIDPLLAELEHLENWTEGDYYDPYIRIGMGVNSSGGIISDEVYGPYADPREKALMIGMHLSVLHALEKNPRWQDYQALKIITYALYTADFIGLDGLIWDNESVIIGALMSTLSWNIVLTKTWRTMSHGRINLSFFNPRNFVNIFRSNNTEEKEVNNSEPQWYERLSETEKNTYNELVNSNAEVNNLSLRDQGKLRDIITLMTIADDIGDTGIHSEFKELGRKLLDNPTFAPIGSAAYANERFWNMKIFQILNRGGLRGNGLYEFVFDNNSLRSPRIGGGHNGEGIDTGSHLPNLGQRIGHTIASGVENGSDTVARNPYMGDLLSLRNAQAYERSPLFYSRDTLKLDAWKSMFMERYKAVNKIFDSLKDYEKYRPDVADDSGLESEKKKIEEMRKQFLQGNVVKVYPAGHADAGKPELDGDGKLQFVPNTQNPEGNRPTDFEKFAKDWMKVGNPDFDLDYGKALKDDAITDEERRSGTLLNDLGKAETYAGSHPTVKKETMLQRIRILRDRLAETGEIPEGETQTPYTDHMTRTEFYQRLGMIMDGNGSFNDALNINNKGEFEAATAEVDKALTGNTPKHVLTNIFNTSAVAEQAARAEEKAFNPRNLFEIETREGKILLKAELYAISQGDENMLGKLGNISTLVRNRKVMSGFFDVLRDDIGIPDTVNFDKTIEAFRSDAMRNIVTIGNDKFYIENIIPGEESTIQRKITEIRTEQQRTRDKGAPIDGESTIMQQVIDDLNLDGGGRKISTRQILIDAIRRAF